MFPDALAAFGVRIQGMYQKYLKNINLRDFLNNVNISLVNKYVYFSEGGPEHSIIKYILQTLEIDRTPFQVKSIHDRLRSPLLSPYQVTEEHFEQLLEDESFTKFGFVSNPYTRLLFAYQDRVCRPTVSRRRLFRELKKGDNEEVKFEEFIKYICNQADHLNDSHWRPQSSAILSEFIPLDKFGHIESFQRDALGILKAIFPNKTEFVDGELSNYSVESSNNISTLLDYYHRVDMDLFMAKYGADFDAFNYSRILEDTL